MIHFNQMADQFKWFILLIIDTEILFKKIA